MKNCLRLLLVFMKIGVMSFGGGYVMLPLMQRELVEKRGWLSEEDLADIFAAAQCSPGLIAGNTAVYVGNMVAGFWGGLFAVVGVVLPSLVIILLLASVLSLLRGNHYFVWAMNGIKIVVCGLILGALVKLWKKSVHGWLGYSLFLVSLTAALFLPISSVFIVLFGALVGIAVFLVERGRRRE